ncbi:MAG: DUF427 domain-containing protein, partial [Anaerolineales bacterium]
MTQVQVNDSPTRYHTFQHAGVESSPRWVRVEFNGSFVADSRNVMLSLEEGRPPTYYFPKTDVHMDWTEPSEKIAKFPHKGETMYRHVRVGDRLAENAIWIHPELPDDRSALADHVAFKWSAMDAWYEEEEQVFVHPRDPYTRVDAIPSSRHIRVEVDGVTIADTRQPILLFETGLPIRYYLPPADVKMNLLKESSSHTRCPYKGLASYYSLELSDRLYQDLIWVYREPVNECSHIKGMLAFYNEKVDLYVDGDRQPRP